MKLIICDMSGIASTKGKNNEELLNALNNLKNYTCSFCTGKGYNGGYQTLKNVNLKVPFICENGSVIVNKDGSVVYNDSMDYDKVKKLIYDLESYPYEFLAYVDLKTHKYKFLRGTKKLTEDLSQPWFYSEEIYNNTSEFLDNIDKNNICRITTRGLEVNENLEEFNDFHVVVSENEFHSICNKGINKGHGVMKLAELCNVDLKDVIVIGNDLNDVDMFKLGCVYKIATGITEPPKELLELSDVYIPLDDLPRIISEIDTKGVIC